MTEKQSDLNHEQSHSKLSKFHVKLACGVLAIGALGIAGNAVYHKVEKHRAASDATNLRKAKIVNDAHNAAVSVIEQQRLNPATVKVMGGLMIISSGRVLASSPKYLSIPSAPGNMTVPEGKVVAVLNPIKVGNIFQFSDSCSLLLTKEYRTSELVADKTYWISGNVTTSPEPMRGESAVPAVRIDRNTAQIFDGNNLAVNCARLINTNEIDFMNQLAGTRTPGK